MDIKNKLIRFGEVDKNGNLFLKKSVDKQMFEDLKIRGEIKDFAIDDNGVMIIKEIQIKSADYYLTNKKNNES